MLYMGELRQHEMICGGEVKELWTLLSHLLFDLWMWFASYKLGGYDLCLRVVVG